MSRLQPCIGCLDNKKILRTSIVAFSYDMVVARIDDLNTATDRSGASAISEGDIFIYSCSAQLISFEIESTSKEINGAVHEYMNMSPSLIALAPLLATDIVKSVYIF